MATNADKIRQMTDEEIVYMIMPGDYTVCPDRIIGQRNCREDCTECVLEWLREEANNDLHNNDRARIYSAGVVSNIGGRGGDLEVETVKPWTKSALKTALLIFAITLPLNLTATETIISRQAERTVKPPPVEAPATTAREEIVTGVCDFGGCPVATTLPPTTEPETTTEHVSDTYTLTEPVTEWHDYGYIGTFCITGYTAEEGFQEGSDTASGYGVRPGYCAMNAEQRRSLGISYGDQIYVKGLGTYTVMDSGCGWGVVDIWVYTDAEAYSITGNYDVYLI